MNRFFVEGRRSAGETVDFDGGDARKIALVLRMSDGDEVEIIDSAAQRFHAKLHFDGRAVSATLGEPLPSARGEMPHIAVAQGIPKGQKMDFVVEKLTELGAAEILPLQSERSVADASSNKLERWRRLAKSAAQQCGRAELPIVTEPVSYEQLLAKFGLYDCVLMPWELADPAPLRERLPDLVKDARRFLVVIGPEGGFSHDEAERARAAGAQLVSLGSRILRTETAALVAVALLTYLREGV